MGVASTEFAVLWRTSSRHYFLQQSQ